VRMAPAYERLNSLDPPADERRLGLIVQDQLLDLDAVPELIDDDHVAPAVVAASGARSSGARSSGARPSSSWPCSSLCRAAIVLVMFPSPVVGSETPWFRLKR